ncbi:urease accessory protein UreE [Reticulomyxa filosa]|uniref:Urease accessory protein UreE n=1 Tax=Reticulomyxa filosa TaxID=46433 RepID=X6PDP5_RETFI|nr:urease accessory protein UreE [Reticulomyxa filosa]|eukprot:ETO35787.1 urease accessory protein UreE [Reticulomyxa filosa]
MQAHIETAVFVCEAGEAERVDKMEGHAAIQQHTLQTLEESKKAWVSETMTLEQEWTDLNEFIEQLNLQKMQHLKKQTASFQHDLLAVQHSLRTLSTQKRHFVTCLQQAIDTEKQLLDQVKVLQRNLIHLKARQFQLLHDFLVLHKQEQTGSFSSSLYSHQYKYNNVETTTTTMMMTMKTVNDIECNVIRRDTLLEVHGTLRLASGHLQFIPTTCSTNERKSRDKANDSHRHDREGVGVGGDTDENGKREDTHHSRNDNNNDSVWLHLADDIARVEHVRVGKSEKALHGRHILKIVTRKDVVFLFEMLACTNDSLKHNTGHSHHHTHAHAHAHGQDQDHDHDENLLCLYNNNCSQHSHG